MAAVLANVKVPGSPRQEDKRMATTFEVIFLGVSSTQIDLAARTDATLYKATQNSLTDAEAHNG
jgi:hypothetical protein